LTSEIHEFDVVKLKDGREGTVVGVYRLPGLPLAYEVELDDGELETVKPEQIERITWKAEH